MLDYEEVDLENRRRLCPNFSCANMEWLDASLDGCPTCGSHLSYELRCRCGTGLHWKSVTKMLPVVGTCAHCGLRLDKETLSALVSEDLKRLVHNLGLFFARHTKQSVPC